MFPGPKCALCCTIFSIWGLVTLLALGGLWRAGYRKLDPAYTVPNQTRMDEAAQASFIAAAIYLVFMIGCGTRWICLRNAMRNKKAVRFEK